MASTVPRTAPFPSVPHSPEDSQSPFMGTRDVPYFPQPPSCLFARGCDFGAFFLASFLQGYDKESPNSSDYERSRRLLC